MSGESTGSPVSVRFTPEEQEFLRQYAASKGVTLSELLRGGARQVVNPTRGTYTAVDEALPYRFDRAGRLTAGPDHDFSTDLIAGATGDREALKRAEKFMWAQFDTDTTDVAALNPARQRSELWVGQQPFAYPIWRAIEKGTLQDITPFVIPKFASASGLVAGHTEGSEPTPGTYTATAQTIMPGAVSGKLEVTREAWESGGNPQMSGILWQQMVQAWFEGLEAGAAALLDSLTPTQITLPAGAQDAALVTALKNALAALQFTRGGYRMRNFPGQVDLFKALVGARDADGRQLLPVVGAENADGMTDRYFGAVNVGGQLVQPAWALAASSMPGGGARSSYLFDADMVCGWASAPRRLEFHHRVSHVEVAIWGYQALACTDVTGVREVLYNPVGS